MSLTDLDAVEMMESPYEKGGSIYHMPAIVPLLKPVEAAQILNVSRSKFYMLAREGKIRVLEIGDSIRVTETALAEYIDKSVRK